MNLTTKDNMKTMPQSHWVSFSHRLFFYYKETEMSELQECIFEALKILIEIDEDLIKTQLKEECINHKLAQHLETVLKERNLLYVCSVDVEYNKYKENEEKTSNGRNIRPDILVHERKSGNRNNLIVIEAKKEYDKKADRDKVVDLVDSRNFLYSLGVVISYFPKKGCLKIKFYEGGQWKKYLMNKNSFEIIETER